MKRIDDDIKINEYKQFYLLYGPEAYLRLKYRDKLVKSIKNNLDEMNFTSFEGNNIDVNELITVADTLPFFADYRVILIQNSGFFKHASDELNDYIKKSCPDTTKIIFVEKELDKRNALYKTISGYGRAVELTCVDEPVMIKWIAKLLSEYELKISAATASYLISKTGPDMTIIKNEVDKLGTYAYGKEAVSNADIDAVVITRIDNHIFDMVEAICSENPAKALRLYRDLITIGEKEMGIIRLIAGQFNKMLISRDLKKRGYDKKQIAGRLGVKEWTVGNLLRMSSALSISELRAIVEDTLMVEEGIFSGKMTQGISLETFIVRSANRKALIQPDKS